MKKFLLGMLLGVLLIPIGLAVYIRIGRVPVAVGDKPFPLESKLVHIPMHKRMRAEAPTSAPIEASPTTLEAGAHIYRQQCSSCHGLYGRPTLFAEHMYPDAPQLWQPHGNGVVGVSDDPPGQTYWTVANGIRLTGMPSFNNVLNQTEMWQVSLLLANADKPLPPQVLDLLKKPLDYDLPLNGAGAVPAAPATK